MVKKPGNCPKIVGKLSKKTGNCSKLVAKWLKMPVNCPNKAGIWTHFHPICGPSLPVVYFGTDSGTIRLDRYCGLLGPGTAWVPLLRFS